MNGLNKGWNPAWVVLVFAFLQAIILLIEWFVFGSILLSWPSP